MKRVNSIGIFLPRIFKAVLVGDGWNDSFGWVSLNTARKSGKPVMLVVSKPSCPRCRHLKAKLVTHAGVKKLSPYFAMVHALPEELPQDGNGDDAFHPDGRYVPRILFFDNNFNFMPEVRGPISSYQYFYGEPDNVEISMVNALIAARNRHIST
ncbi:thioredoxin domain-containing protein 12 [Elysia marginata]|uniref:Thioredoxin domain-containing protein 12 n=1 Tax=Elysia marginata TaxID=1093978 RepID=A0AAV4ESX5_9GAST|nr:thioredoxin domain-containing protein 12 [Elysia marginata]